MLVKVIVQLQTTHGACVWSWKAPCKVNLWAIFNSWWSSVAMTLGTTWEDLTGLAQVLECLFVLPSVSFTVHTPILDETVLRMITSQPIQSPQTKVNECCVYVGYTRDKEVTSLSNANKQCILIELITLLFPHHQKFGKSVVVFYEVSVWVVINAIYIITFQL